MKKNQKVKLDISSWAPKGLAKGRIENIDIAIPFTAPGDRIEAHILKVSPNYTYAKCLTLKKASAKREKPRCEVFGKCGGCQLQHVTYETQLAYKKEQLAEAFTSQNISIPEFTVQPCESPYEYRNKSQFSICKNPEGEINIGLSAPRSQRIIDAKTCHIQDQGLQDCIDILRAFLEKEDLHLSHVVTRIAYATQEIMMGLVTPDHRLDKNHPQLKKLIDILSQQPNLASLYLNINDNPEWVVLGDTETLLWGKPRIEEQILDVKIALSLRSFFQVNPQQIPFLWDCISKMLCLEKGQTAWDLYAGAGALSIYLAKQGLKVIGVESHPEAVADAKMNATTNAIENTQFIEGAVESIIPTLDAPCDAIILDPPRTGIAKKAMAAIGERLPKRIVMVSCMPETLSRDVAILKTFGYQIKALQALDMFPQTYHVETVLCLEHEKV